MFDIQSLTVNVYENEKPKVSIDRMISTPSSNIQLRPNYSWQKNLQTWHMHETCKEQYSLAGTE